MIGAENLTSAEKVALKQQALEQVGASVVYSPELIGQTVKKAMKKDSHDA